MKLDTERRDKKLFSVCVQAFVRFSDNSLCPDKELETYFLYLGMVSIVVLIGV